MPNFPDLIAVVHEEYKYTVVKLQPRLRRNKLHYKITGASSAPLYLRLTAINTRVDWYNLGREHILTTLGSLHSTNYTFSSTLLYRAN